MNKPDQNSKPAFSGERVRLGDVCQIVSGATPKTGNPEYWNGSIKWITPAELSGNSHVVTDSAKHITDAGFASANLKMLPIGTVLLTTRAPIGKVAITGSEMSCNQGFKNLICSDLVYNEYLFRHLKFRASDLQALGRGATFKELSKRDVENFEIVLPPKERQNEAVEKLSHVEKAKEIASLQITHLQSLVKSRFVEMFGKELWQKKSIGDLALDIRYGTSKKASNAGKYTYLRMNNITDDGRLDFSDTKKIDLEDDELEKCTARKGDLLFNRTNSREKVGKTAVFMENDPMVIAGYIIRVRLGDEVRSQYLATFMNLPTTKSLLRSISKGAVHQANINSKELASIEVPVPPKEIQDTFAAFAGRAAKLEFVAQQQIEKLQTLYDSLAQEYFG